MGNRNNKVKRLTKAYRLIRVDRDFMLHCIMDNDSRKLSVNFPYGLLYIVLSRPFQCNAFTFDSICRLILETNCVDFIELFKEARNRGLNVQIKPLENWVVRFPELAEIL